MPSRFLSRFALFGLLPVIGLAASRIWTGSAGMDFETPADWSALPVSDLATDLGVFSSTPAAKQPRLSASRSLAGLSSDHSFPFFHH